MFEDSFVSARVSRDAGRTRVLKLASCFVQLALVLSWITLPLLHPDRLLLPSTILHALPRLERPRQPARMTKASLPHTLSSVSMAPLLFPTAPRIARPALIAETSAPIAELSSVAFGPPSPVPASILANVGPSRAAIVGPAVSSTPSDGAPLHVSSGVSAGLLLAPIRPQYPRIAALSCTEGTVVVEAVISKHGIIESAHVLSGPALLQASALEAVLAARYRPYRLNGEPTAVETRITVNYRLSRLD